MKLSREYFNYTSGHKWLDEAIKDQSIDELNGLLKLLKINETITGFNKTEYTSLLAGERRCDLVCPTKNNCILNIEASYIKPQYKDIIRQFIYASNIYTNDFKENPRNPKWNNEKNYTPVESIFLTAQPMKEKEININMKKECPKLGSKIYTFKDINCQKYLKQINKKIDENKKISYEEIAFLKFIILTVNKKEIYEVLNKAIKLLKQDKTIHEEIKLKIELIYTRNTILYIDKEEDQNKLLEELTMDSTMINQFAEIVKNEAIEEGIMQGIERGREEGIMQGIERGREEERNKIKEILESKNIPKETINEIMNKSK